MNMRTVTKLSLIGLGLLAGVSVQAGELQAMPAFSENARILFQGDSITDGNRGRSADPNHILGHGYCFIIAAQYGAQFPEKKLTFMNRGISGNTVSNLQARWQKDTLDLKPDVLSILIGVNDNGRGVPILLAPGTDCSSSGRESPHIMLQLCKLGDIPLWGIASQDRPDLNRYPRLHLVVDQPAGREHGIIEMRGKINPSHE